MRKRMDKTECVAKLNLLSISTVEEIEIWGKTIPEYTVVLYGNNNQGVGYIYTVYRLDTIYKSYTMLLKHAIDIILNKKKYG